MFFVFFVLFSCFQMYPNKTKIGWGVGGFGLNNPSFSRVFEFILT